MTSEGLFGVVDPAPMLSKRVWSKNLNEAHSGNTIGPELMVVFEIFQGQRLTTWLPLAARSAATARVRYDRPL